VQLQLQHQLHLLWLVLQQLPESVALHQLQEPVAGRTLV
jgi:hypothetical protein